MTKPLNQQNIPKSKVKIQKRQQNVDSKTIEDISRTVSWRNYSRQTGVVKQV